MIKFPTAALLLAASWTLCGCNHLEFYADTKHDWVTPAIADKNGRTPVRVEVAFLRNEQPVANDDVSYKATAALKREVIRAVDESPNFRPVEDASAAAVLTVTANDTTYAPEQPGPGFFVSGLTYGKAAVSKVTDLYDFNLRYHEGAGKNRYGKDKHAIWTRYGERPPPSVRGPYRSTNAAFRAVVEDVVLSFLKDVSETGDSDDSMMFVPQDQ